MVASHVLKFSTLAFTDQISCNNSQKNAHSICKKIFYRSSEKTTISRFSIDHVHTVIKQIRQTEISTKLTVPVFPSTITLYDPSLKAIYLHRANLLSAIVAVSKLSLNGDRPHPLIHYSKKTPIKLNWAHTSLSIHQQYKCT